MLNGFRRCFRRRSVRPPSRPPTGRWVPRHPNGTASMPHGRWGHPLRPFHHTASIIAHVQSGVQSIRPFLTAIATAERRSASEAVAGTRGLRPGRSAGPGGIVGSCSRRRRSRPKWTDWAKPTRTGWTACLCRLSVLAQRVRTLPRAAHMLRHSHPARHSSHSPPPRDISPD